MVGLSLGLVAAFAGAAPTLEELEHLQQQLFELLVKHHGPAAAAAVSLAARVSSASWPWS